MIIAGCLLGLLAAAAYTAVSPRVYSAQATVFVTVTGAKNLADLQQGEVFAAQRAPTYAALATTPVVLRQAARSLDNGTTVADLAGATTVTVQESTSIIEINTTGGSSSGVADSANAVASALTQLAVELDAPSGAKQISLSVVGGAKAPNGSDSPKVRTNLLLGLIVGLVFGIAVVAVRRSLDTRLSAAEDFGRIPDSFMAIPLARRGESADDARREGFRGLRLNLVRGHGVGGTIAVGGVTSAVEPFEFATQLAAAFAEVGRRVLVIDARIADALNLEAIPAVSSNPGEQDGEDGLRDVNLDDVDQSASEANDADSQDAGRATKPIPTVEATGLAAVLDGTTDWGSAIQVADERGVQVMAAGYGSAVSVHRVESPAMAELLDSILESQTFDHIILVSNPVSVSVAAVSLAGLADTCVLVAEARRTSRLQYLFAVDRLADADVTAVSVVLDHVQTRDMLSGVGRSS